MRYAPYNPADADALVQLWNRSFERDFPMDRRLWDQNVDRCEWTYLPGCWTTWDGDDLVGFAIAKSPNNINSIAVDPDYRRRGIGREVLAKAVEALTSPAGRSAASRTVGGDPPTRLLTGQDYGHFFPGVPESCPGAFSFFTACGWKRTDGWAVDLWRDLDAFQIAPDVQQRMSLIAAQGIELRSCTHADVDSLLSHIAQNYSKRWLAETKQRIELEPDASEIKVAVRDGDVIGFAHTFTKLSVKLGPSVYWRGLLGPEYGGLGPIGVGTDVRKIGLGLALLSFGIAEVKLAGMQRMAIDWTVLVDFYGRVGFDVWKRYVPFVQSTEP